MGNCRYCLCRVCSGFNCPRWKKYCGIPCIRGTIMECDFFTNKQSVHILKVKKHYPTIRVEDLCKLQHTINEILRDYEPELKKDTALEGSLSDQLYREKKRHQETMSRIMAHARKKYGSGEK